MESPMAEQKKTEQSDKPKQGFQFKDWAAL